MVVESSRSERKLFGPRLMSTVIISPSGDFVEPNCALQASQTYFA